MARQAHRPAPPAGRSGRKWSRKERFDDAGLVGLEPAGHLAPQAPRGVPAAAAARRSARASPPDRRAAGTGPACSRKTRRRGPLQIRGEAAKAPARTVRPVSRCGIDCLRQRPVIRVPRGRSARDSVVGAPPGVALVQKRQDPAAIRRDNRRCPDARCAAPTGPTAAGGPHPQRQAQFRHRAGAFGPVRVASGHRGKVRLVIEARHGVVGLRLQERRLDPAGACRLKPRHPPPIQQVGHKRGDEHRLARAAEAGDAEPDDRFEERLRHRRTPMLSTPRPSLSDSAPMTKGANARLCPLREP